MTRLPLGAIKELISALTVTDYAPDGWSVLWANQPFEFEGLRNDTLGAWIELNIQGFKSKGVDDFRSEYNPTSDALDSVFYGLRMFTLSVNCQSYAPDIPAWDILEAIRLRVNNPGSTIVNGILKPNGLSWIRSHPIVTLPIDKQAADTRVTWRAVLDIEFSWLSAAQATRQGGFISTIGQSEIDAPQGSNDIPGTLLNPDGSVHSG